MIAKLAVTKRIAFHLGFLSADNIYVPESICCEALTDIIEFNNTRGQNWFVNNFSCSKKNSKSHIKEFKDSVENFISQVLSDKLKFHESASFTELTEKINEANEMALHNYHSAEDFVFSYFAHMLVMEYAEKIAELYPSFGSYSKNAVQSNNLFTWHLGGFSLQSVKLH